MKRNLRNERRKGALERLQTTRASMPKRILDEKDKSHREVLIKDMQRMDNEISTLESRILIGV